MKSNKQLFSDWIKSLIDKKIDLILDDEKDSYDFWYNDYHWAIKGHVYKTESYDPGTYWTAPCGETTYFKITGVITIWKADNDTSEFSFEYSSDKGFKLT